MRGWFETQEVAPRVYAICEPGHFEEVISYLVEGEERAILFDTGMGIANIREEVMALTERPITVVNSHSHWDHVGDNCRFPLIAIHYAEAHLLREGVSSEELRREMRAEMFLQPPPVGFNPSQYKVSPSRASLLLDEGSLLDLGKRTLTVLHTPGHSPGSISLLEEEEGLLFSGDTAYAGPLYAQLPESDFDLYRESMERLAGLVPQLSLLLPSHNVTPLDPAILTEMAKGFGQIASGEATYEYESSPWGRIRNYRFERFSVYLSE
ncbi:MAG: MBL fold metallo-hydrolase [Anaerolineae bacterium]|nr:MBL fold metallo-hydrolase [Anaerolineae bacterium]